MLCNCGSHRRTEKFRNLVQGCPIRCASSPPWLREHYCHLRRVPSTRALPSTNYKAATATQIAGCTKVSTLPFLRTMVLKAPSLGTHCVRFEMKRAQLIWPRSRSPAKRWLTNSSRHMNVASLYASLLITDWQMMRCHAACKNTLAATPARKASFCSVIIRASTPARVFSTRK